MESGVVALAVNTVNNLLQQAADTFSGKCFVWWRGEDSNLRSLRRQIYSLLPLAAREPLQGICLAMFCSWDTLPGSSMELATGIEPATC